ncbi:MAG: recombination protein O N-terminal domain-containing protein [Victivallaceae bacterium]|nr:recombination protein O N-terminal domain-containing protein [Victivallaceae bacterium]
MGEVGIESAEMIVLRRTPYRETDVIIAGLSPDFGKLELIAYRAAKPGSGMSALDLFCRVNVAFRPANRDGGLGTLTEAETTEDYADLAKSQDNLQFAARIGRFLLRNSAENSPLPLSFDTLGNILSALCGRIVWSRVQCAVMLKLVFLYENGLLPGLDSMPEVERRKVEAVYERLTECAVGGDAPPDFSEKYWTGLDGYLNGRIVQSQLLWK